MYPKVPRVFKELSNEVVVLPNQSMTLADIIKRFVRKESLPVAKEGIYHESEYDLEKVAKADLTERMDVLNEVREKVKRTKKKMDEADKVKRPPASVDPVPPVDPPKV